MPAIAVGTPGSPGSPGVYGDVGQTGAGTIGDPFTLNGTQVTGLIDNMYAWAARVERHAQSSETLCELWFLRDSVWQLMPSPVLADERTHPVLRRKYRQPAQLSVTIANVDGYLTRSNRESPYNYNLAAGFDPVIDAHRKVLLRVGARCYYNLAAGITPTSTLAPTSGALSLLTDGLFADFSQTTPAAVQWTAVDTTPVFLLFDLGSVQNVRNVAIRFGTANRATAGYALPASVAVALSLDNVTYTTYPVRPVGGDGAASVAPGDWDDDPYGAATEIPFCALRAYARYVKIRVTPVGAQTWTIDEVGIWGGSSSAFLGANRFCGYLGDGVSITSEGAISLAITDVLKKLADNNESRLTSRFGLVDVADIAYSLLTGATYWRGATSSAYDYPWQPSEIGWSSGTAYTGFTMPIWQGTGNNHLGYQYELWHEVGWHLWADGNGVLQATEPPYRQYRPDYVSIASEDGNQDARLFVRDLSDKDIRNVIEVTTGSLKGGPAGSITLLDPASVARYGHLRTIVTDQLATTPDMRQKLAAGALRDYAWRLDTLLAEISPDFDTAIKNVHAFRTGQVPNATLGRVMLRAKTCTVVGQRCAQELWSLEAIEEHISAANWYGRAVYRPYVPAAIDPPAVVSLTPGSGATATQMVLLWNQASDFTVSPSAGNGAVSAQSGAFTVSINGFTNVTSTTIALSDGGTGGTFKDHTGSVITTLTFAASGASVGPAPQTFTYTPSAGYSGPRILTLTASGAFSKVHTVHYTAGAGVYFPPVRNDVGQFALAGFNVYLSSVGESDPAYVLQNGSLIAAYRGGAAVTSYTLTGLTPGDPYWVYMTAVDTNGHESEPGVIVSAFAAAGAASAGNWTVTDLASAFDSVAGPDATGYYTYQFSHTWTSPPNPAPFPDHGLWGFKRMSINFSVGALPADPNANPGGWQHNRTDEWAGDRVPPGMMWDRVTPGQLSWQTRFRVAALIPSTTHVYFRMITSSRTTSWRGAFQSNISSLVIP